MKMTFGKRAIDKIYKRRDRYEIPEWQRQEVWSQPKKQLLIDSILRGWKLPKFYFLKDTKAPDQYEVLDGQQRLVSIFEFFDGDLSLSSESQRTFGAAKYRDLPEKYSDAFDDYEIEFDEIEEADEKEIREFFQRLQLGLPLTSSERLNSVLSKLRDFVRQVATKHSFFERVFVPDTRYGHFDILSKVAAIEIEGIDVGLRFDDLRNIFENQASFSNRSNVAKRISGALDFVNEGFSDKQASKIRNRTVLQSLLTLACDVVETGNANGKDKSFAAFFETFLIELNRQVELGPQATDTDYLSFQRTVNANVKAGAKIRHRILVKKLLNADPTFIEVFDPTAVLAAGLHGSVRDDAQEVSALIGQANTVYSSKHGVDLFKATNKTAQALVRIGKPLKEFGDYKTFIEDLYFLVHESVGQRIPSAPQTFRDINDLRTDLEHDIDHGKASKIRSKRKRIGGVFSKYSGATTPGVLAPERFLMVQSNILGALKSDIRALAI